MLDARGRFDNVNFNPFGLLEQTMSLEKLTSRHEAMILRLVEGATQNEVCQEFDITQSRLSVIRNSDIWQRKEKELRNEVKDNAIRRLETLRGAAIDALEDCVSSEIADSRVRLMSAKEILNRTGLSECTRMETDFKPTINLYMPKSWAVTSVDDGLGEEEDA